jgi:nucleoside-diphosphate-sugar epimerase
VEQLARDGHEIINLDLCRPDWDNHRMHTRVGDVRDASAVDAAMAGCNAVYHLAAAHHDTGISEATYFDVNERGTQVLVDAMARYQIDDLSFVSTVAVYGATDRVPTERSEPRPLSHYGASKLAAEKVIAKWLSLGTARRAVVVRPSVVFGPHNFANMYSLMRQIHSGRFVQVGSGDNIKSMCYVDNLVGFMRFLANKQAPGLALYNYVDKPDMCSRDIVATIYQAFGRDVPTFSVPLTLALALMLPVDALSRLLGKQLPVSGFRIRKFAANETHFDATAAHTSGYVPAVPLLDGIRRMADWYEREGRSVAPVWRIPPASWVTPSGAAPQVVTPT